MTNTAIIPHEPAAIALLFQNGGAAIDPLLTRIETEVRSHVADLTTKKGRDAIASLAFKVSKSKTALDTAGKALTETQKAEIKIVDDARKKIRDRLDDLRDEARKPLTDWEAAEEDKAARIERTMSDLRRHGVSSDEHPGEIQSAANFIKSIPLDGIEGPALEVANETRMHTLDTLRTMYLAAVQREADAAELAALRLEQQTQRDEADRIAQIAADKQAELQAIIDDAQRVERERVAEEERAAEYEAHKLAAVEAARVEADAKHAAELQKMADEEQDERDAQDARDADMAHRGNVFTAISDALKAMSGNATPDNIATALFNGDIPHTKVTL